MKRIIDLMREYSIGVNSVNYILAIFKLKPVTPNCRVSTEEYDFIVKILSSDELREVYILQKKIDGLKSQISRFEPDFKMPPSEEENVISKQYFFNEILKMNGGKSLFESLNLDRLYAESSYKVIYDWCSARDVKTIVDIQAAVNKFYNNVVASQDYELGVEKTSKDYNKVIVDDESVVMGALRNGCGDKFGF